MVAKSNGTPVKPQRAALVLEDGTRYSGTSFGYSGSIAGEVVFNTGMVGYPETFTDPSYRGQILILTYPLVGNYGIPRDRRQNRLNLSFESSQIQISALIISDYSRKYSHWNATRSLADWLIENQVPAIEGIDTRALTKKLREQGTMLGKVVLGGKDVPFYDPNLDNLVSEVSVERPVRYGSGDKRILLVDCGCKHNIIQNFLQRGFEVLRVPWDYDISNASFDGLFVSNGPGDPKMYRKTIYELRQALAQKVPVFGICLGHQLLALAAGANTFKLKYGHRSQNQPVLETGTNRCLITSQNHGFAVDNATLPKDWSPWFVNLNDGTNEGLRHREAPAMSVQFHPEAAPGPVDANPLFDEFQKLLAHSPPRKRGAAEPV